MEKNMKDPFEEKTMEDLPKPKSVINKVEVPQDKEISVNEFIHTKNELPTFAKKVMSEFLKHEVSARAKVSDFEKGYDRVMNKKRGSEKRIKIVPKNNKKREV
jgi:hypothetical protein